VNRAMKKMLLIMWAIIFLSMAVSAKNFTFSIDGNYLSVVDRDFKTLYGGKKYFPEGKLTLKCTGNLYFWGSFGYSSASYTWKEWSNKGIPVADLDGKSVANRYMISGGLGYYIGYIQPGNFAIKMELGLCNITNRYKDTTVRISDGQTIKEITKKESGLGLRGIFGVTYGFYKNLYSEISVGYLYAKDKVDTTNTVELGGFRLSLGIGLKF
jgi:hypothetical protein